MAKRQVVRPGARWQPDMRRQPKRVAGRLRWRRPRLRMPRLTDRWRSGLLFALAATGALAGVWWVYNSPLLSVREVNIDGNNVLSAELLREVADIEGESILRTDVAGASERLLALPLVKDVQIRREWPASVGITIVERTPWGVWDADGQRLVVDDEGVVLDQPAPEGAPLILQSEAVGALAPGDRVDAGAVAVARELVPTAERTVGRRVVALEFSQKDGLTAILAGGPDQPRLRVTFGDAQGFAFKIASLYAVLRQADAEDRTLVSVDLRFGDRVAVREAAEVTTEVIEVTEVSNED